MNEKKTTPMDRVRAFFAPPRFEDEEKNQLAVLLNFITSLFLFIIGLSTLGAIFFSLFSPDADASRSYTAILARVGPYLLSLIVVRVVLRRGSVVGATRIFVVSYWLNVTVELFTNGGVSSPSFASYLIVILVTGLLMGSNASLFVTGISMVAGIVASVLKMQNILPVSLTPMGPVNDVISMIVSMVTVMGVLRLYLTRQEQIANGLRVANQELQQSSLKLEQQVKERTRALTTSVEVSRRISTILDPQRLVSEVVNELQSSFGYYHVQVYLFDEHHQHLVLVGGAGDAGRMMVASNHQIEYGKGLVGRAGETGQAVLVADVSQAPGWLPNPLLPETCAEVAVPIMVGSEVLGVLDVQQNQTAVFGTQDVELLQSIGNQVAIALQNARAYSSSQRQTQREAFVAGLSQKIQGATTIDEVLQVAVSQLGQSLGAQRASIELRSPDAVKNAQTGSRQG